MWKSRGSLVFVGTKLQGCQMVYFQTKNPSLGKFWRALYRFYIVEWKMLVYIWYGHLENFTTIWYTFGVFGTSLVIWYISPFWYIVSRKIWQPKLGVFAKNLFTSAIDFKIIPLFDGHIKVSRLFICLRVHT
jgi:hypothetical protein